jgi:hypothetical protein
LTAQNVAHLRHDQAGQGGATGTIRVNRADAGESLWKSWRSHGQRDTGREAVTFKAAYAMWWRIGIGDANMNIARPLGAAEIEKSSEVDVGGNIHELARGSSAVFRQGEDAEMSTDNLAGLLRRVAEASTREVDGLIGDLQALRRKLNTDGNRIQRDIAEYNELSQQVMQLANIISESVKKLPVAPGIGR